MRGISSSVMARIKSFLARPGVLLGGALVLYAILFYAIFCSDLVAVSYSRAEAEVRGIASSTKALIPSGKAELDTKLYDKKMLELANYASSTPTTTPRIWPVQGPYPKAGAILPFNRILAYYGNFYSTKMGVLGEYPEEEMLRMLRAEKAKWEAADPTTPVVLAIDYIDVTAQELPGKDGKYRLRMPDSQIDKALAIAKKVDGIVILELQIGLSDFATELSLLEHYLAMPNVHLAIDPEFAMKSGDAPGTVIGSVSAADVNYVSNYLADLVKEHDLPPKILLIHRFTERMVTGYRDIKLVPEVQIVMDMDGWGSPAKKLNTYEQFVASQPVQFTGFKIFYKNDLKPPSTRLLTPEELLKLTPRPSFIQFQ